jgi:RNA polymerase sigma factor (sigma-70 family)
MRRSDDPAAGHVAGGPGEQIAAKEPFCAVPVPGMPHEAGACGGARRTCGDSAVEASCGDPDRAALFMIAAWRHAVSHARRAGAHHHDADDAASEVVLAILARDERLGPVDPARLGGFVAVVAVREARRTRLRWRVPAARPMEGGTLDPSQLVEREDTNRRVRDAVRALPHAERRLLELRYWDGLTLDELARASGVSRTTTLRRLGRNRSAPTPAACPCARLGIRAHSRSVTCPSPLPQRTSGEHRRRPASLGRIFSDKVGKKAALIAIDR